MRRYVASLLVLSSVALLRCAESACTLIGCGDPFEVQFTGSTGKAGVYEIGVVADGVASTCQITLPRTCGNEPVCSRDNLPWYMRLSGCSEGNAETITAVSFKAAPLTVELAVRRDGMVVGEAKVRPEYTESHPNGPECGTCSSAPRHMTAIAP